MEQDVAKTLEAVSESPLLANVEFWAVGAIGVVIGIFLAVLVMKPTVMVAISRIIGVLLIAAGAGLLVSGIMWMVDGSTEPGVLAGYTTNARVCIGLGAAGLVGGMVAIAVTFFRAGRSS